MDDLIADAIDLEHLLHLEIVKEAERDIDVYGKRSATQITANSSPRERTIAIGKEQSVQRRLRSMTGTSVLSPRFHFQGDGQSFVILSVVVDDLDSSVHIPLQSVHRRPDVLLNLEKFVDAQGCFCSTAILNDGCGLFPVSKHFLKIKVTKKNAHRRSGTQKHLCPRL